MPRIPYKPVKLRVPQLRVLKVLGAEGSPLLTNAKLKERAGFTPVSGTVTRALNGLVKDCKSGSAHKGLLSLGMVAFTEIDIDGVAEKAYFITEIGKEALEATETKVPTAVRSREMSTNDRYKG